MMREGVGLKEETGKEINESGSKCDVSGTLEIFKEFNEVYRQRLKKTDEACGDATQLKLKTLEDWVADLTEQNTVLVETVEALEKEALYRLELGINAEKCSRFDGFNVVDVCKVCKNKVHVNADGVCGKPKCHAACLSVSDNRGIYQRKINSQLQETEEKLRRAELETEKLKKNLSENESKLEKINKEIVASEKSAKEMRAALTAEVADKHDQVLALRRDVQHLEEKLRQADMQTHFKDDIIKELRKEIKIANSKVATQPKENKVVTILKEKLKDVKIVPDKCGGCSGVLKVILPQLNELKKRVNSGLCELHQKSNSNKNCNRLNMQIQYRMEELLTEIIDCLSVIINSVDAMGQAYDGACKTHHVPLDSRTESHFIPFISANSDTVEEIFVGKPCESSTTTSSVRNDMKQLLNEMQSQEQIIRYLKCALADTQNQLRYYTDNEQVLVNERASFRGGTTSYSLIPPYSSSDNYKSEISCDQLLEELQYLRERSQDDQKAMVQLEEQMKSLILAINTNQCFQGEREGMIQCLKDQLNNIEECLLLGFNNLITDDSSGISPLKNERLCNWKKDLINEIKKACELLSEIDSFSLSHNKEREGFLNSYCMFEQRIKTLQDQIFQSQKAKEKIYDRLCALEKTQREYVASQSASLQKNGCNLGDSFAASVPVTDEVANLLNIIRCKDDVINNKENTIQRLMKEYQLGEQDNIPCYENSTRCDMKKATAEIIEKTLNEFLTFKRILVEKETQFDQLGSDLASLHRTFCTFVKEFPSSKLSKANNLLTQLENDLVYIVKKTKEYVLMCKENEFLVMRAKTRIGSLLAEFGACIQKGSSDQAKKVQQKVAGSDERKPAVTESRLKIAALENQVTCLNKKVEELTCALKEKEKYECHCEDSSLEEDSPEVSKTVLNFSSSKKQVTSCEVNIESKSCECEESGELSVEQQKHLPEELEISPPKLNVESQVEKEGLQKIRQVGQSLETKSSESCESEESSEEQKICFSKEQVVCSHKLDGGHEMEEAQKTDQSIVQSLESKITYQEETISVLQNSLKIEQEEYACLKSKFENIVKEKEEILKTRQSTAQFFEAKIADLEHQLKECHENAAAATVEISSWKASLEDAHIEMKCLQKSNCELLSDKKLLQEQLLCRTTAHEIDKEKLALLEKKTEELRLKICRSVNPLTDSSEVPSCSENTAILAVDPNCKQISPVYQKYKDYQTETSDLITKIREQHTEIYRLKEEIIKLNTILDELRTADKSTDEYPTSACDSVVNLKQDDEKGAVSFFTEASCVTPRPSSQSTKGCFACRSCKCKLTISKLQQLLKSQNFQNFSLKNKIVENNAVIAELQSAMMGKDFNRNTTECQQSTSQNLCCGKSKELEEKLRICACQLFQAEEKCKTLVVDLDIAWNEVDREKKLGQVYCQRIDELRSDISEKTLEANHWENQYHDLRKKLLDSQTIRSDQINEIDKLKSKISHLNSQLSETGKNQNKHYERMLKCANERISSLLTVISTVKGELSELKQGRKGKQQDVASMQIKYEENIKSCHCVIQNSQDTIKKLEEKCYHLDIELETMTNELVKKQNETLEFAQREAQLQQIITDKELEWTQRIRESQAEIYKLTDIVNSLNNDLSIGKAEIEMRRSQQCVAERRLRDAIDCIEKLKNEMEKKDYFAHKLQDALCSTGFKVVQHSKRIDQLENYTACSHQENAVLKASLTKALKGRSDCEEELCKKTEEIKNLNLELYKMKMEKDNITKEANNCHQRLQEKLNGEAYERHCLKEEVDRLKRVLNSVYSQCLKERDTFEEELSKGKDGIFKLKEELEYLRKCHEDSLKLINQKEEYIQNMKCSFLEKGVHNKTENKKIKDRTMCCQERSYLETEVKKLGQVITELESQIKEKDQCINRMKNMTAKDTETINEIEKLKEKLTMNCQAKSLLETEVQKLCQTISRLQSEILEKNKMIKILEGKLKKYENSLKSQCQENLELHERIKQITSASCIVHIKPSTTCTHKFHRKTTT